MCACADLTNERLAKRNSRLSCTASINIETGETREIPVVLATEKLDRGKRDKMGALASFCPFCGKKYEAET